MQQNIEVYALDIDTAAVKDKNYLLQTVKSSSKIKIFSKRFHNKIVHFVICFAKVSKQ